MRKDISNSDETGNAYEDSGNRRWRQRIQHGGPKDIQARSEDVNTLTVIGKVGTFITESRSTNGKL